MESRYQSSEKTEISKVSGQLFEFELPFVHFKIRADDLLPDGSLMSEEDRLKFIGKIDELKKQEIETENSKKGKSLNILHDHDIQFARRFTKTELGKSRYAAIVFDMEYFAIYDGVQQNLELGRGGFGYVKLVWNLKTKAFEVLKLAKIDPNGKEFIILKKVGMGIGYLEREVSDTSGFVKYQLLNVQNKAMVSYTRHQANLVMKLAPGDSLEELKNDPNISIARWFEIFSILFSEYQKLIDKKIVHCDLKPSNIYFCLITNVLTILDYGNSKKKKIILGARGELIGTRKFLAPELNPLLDKSKFKYTVESDLFALGVTLCEVLSLKVFASSKIKDAELFQRTQALYLRLINVSPKLRPNCGECLEFFTSERLAMMNIVTHPFRTIAIFSVDELLKSKETQEKTAKLSLVPKPPVTQVQAVQPRGSLLFSWWQSIISVFPRFFSRNTPPQNPVTIVDNSKEEIIEEKEKTISPDLFFSVLPKFDEVWMLDSKKRNNKDYIILQRELQLKHIQMGRKYFIAETLSDETIEMLNQKIAKSTYSNQYKFFFVTSYDLHSQRHIHVLPLKQDDNDLTSYQRDINNFVDKDVTKAYEEIIIQPLTLLRDNYSLDTTEYKLINDAIKNFQEKFSQHNLSASSLMASLIKLRKDLKKLNKKNQESAPIHLATVFKKPQSQAAASIKAIQKEIESWVFTYQKRQ